MREPVEQLIRSIGYQFKDVALVETALTHRSAGSINNERLEFLGDSILGFVIADELSRRFPEANEGQLSRLRACLVKGESLAVIGRELELGGYLSLGPGELRSGGQSRDSILADALEALFAAVYLDGGYESARGVILRLFLKRLERLSLDAQHKDPKTRLQEFLQARKMPLPTYTVVDISGEQHDQTFRVSCRVEGIDTLSEGVGASRRKAEQAAALQLLNHLKLKHE
ncbi:MAG: ribonuclease III [gamma proteobacterium symbiont of Phacoides pectinatus]